MSVWSRLKNIFGGTSYVNTVPVAATTNVPDAAGVVEFTGTDTITSLTASPSSRGRIVFFTQSDTGNTTLTHTANTTTAGQMDLGAGSIVMSKNDVVCLRLRSDGSWIRYFNTVN